MGVQADIGGFIASLGLAGYNPDAQNVSTVSGEVTKHVRPFLLDRFGEALNSQKIDSLLALVLECDFQAFGQCPAVL